MESADLPQFQWQQSIQQDQTQYIHVCHHANLGDDQEDLYEEL
jgi:hypothetical protein